MELYGQWFSVLHINRKVISDIGDTNLLRPPNKTTTLKSGPQPKIRAEYPHRSVMAVGRATCRMVEKQTLHRGNWKTNHIHVYYRNTCMFEYNYYRNGTYMYIHVHVHLYIIIIDHFPQPAMTLCTQTHTMIRCIHVGSCSQEHAHADMVVISED